jgi:lipooligosaccharide transport system permease protein
VATPTVLRVVEHQAAVYRRFWRGSAFQYVLNPLLFLGALGFGLGGLIDQNQGNVGGVDYLAFVTPGVLAASAMQAAAGESLWPIMAGVKWIRTFHAMVATPVAPADVFSGVLVWTAARALVGATVFLAVAALLGGVLSAWGVLAIPAAALCALAFAAPLGAFSATQETDFRFPVIMRLGIVPLFLFSGTFFPVSQLPDWLQPLAQVSPLYHAVELCRGATTGSIDPGAAVVHVAVLLAFTLAGWLWGSRTFTRRLTQ